MRSLVLVPVVAALLGGCAYKADPIGQGTYDVVTSHSRKLPGKYLLYVEAEKLDGVIRSNQYSCSAHSFPVEGAHAFEYGVKATVDNLVETVEVVTKPVPLDQLRARGARGLIVVRATDLDGRLNVLPGFWQGNMETEVRITAAVTVDAGSGRMLGTTVEGFGRGDAGAGFACEGGANSVRISAEKAMKEVLRKVGEGISNSERVRSGKTS